MKGKKLLQSYKWFHLPKWLFHLESFVFSVEIPGVGWAWYPVSHSTPTHTFVLADALFQFRGRQNLEQGIIKSYISAFIQRNILKIQVSQTFPTLYNWIKGKNSIEMKVKSNHRITRGWRCQRGCLRKPCCSWDLCLSHLLSSRAWLTELTVLVS